MVFLASFINHAIIIIINRPQNGRCLLLNVTDPSASVSVKHAPERVRPVVKETQIPAAPRQSRITPSQRARGVWIRARSPQAQVELLRSGFAHGKKTWPTSEALFTFKYEY